LWLMGRPREGARESAPYIRKRVDLYT